MVKSQRKKVVDGYRSPGPSSSSLDVKRTPQCLAVTGGVKKITHLKGAVTRYVRKSHTTIVIFMVNKQWTAATDKLLTETYETVSADAPDSSPEPMIEDVNARKHVVLWGVILALFSGTVSDARKSIAFLKSMWKVDEKIPTVETLAKKLKEELDKLLIHHRFCDIILLDNRLDVPGARIIHIDINYKNINIKTPLVQMPIAFGSGSSPALKFMEGRIPENLSEARLFLRGAIQRAYMYDENTGEGAVLGYGNGVCWKQTKLASLGSHPITTRHRKILKASQAKIRETLGLHPTPNPPTENEGG